MRRLVVAATALIAVTYGLARFALGLFVPEIRGEFDLSATGVGAVLGASFTGYVVGLVLAGPLVERGGARRVGWWSGALATVGTAGVAAARSPMLLGLAAGVGGVSTGLVSPAMAAAVERFVPPMRRESSQTIINTGTSLGLVAAVPVAVVASAAWRTAWVAFAIAALVATGGFVAAVPAESPRGATAGQRSQRTRPMPQRQHGLSWPGSRLACSAVLLGISSAVFWGFARELLETVWDLPPATSRLTWVTAGVVGMIGGGAGYAVGRVSLRATVAASSVVLAASLAVLAGGPRTPVVALGAAGGFGAAYMAMTGLLIVWSVRARPTVPASAVATAFLVLAAGQMVGSALAGAVGDRAGLATSFAAGAVIAGGTLLSLPAKHGSANTRAGASVLTSTASAHAPGTPTNRGARP